MILVRKFEMCFTRLYIPGTLVFYYRDEDYSVILYGFSGVSLKFLIFEVTVGVEETL